MISKYLAKIFPPRDARCYRSFDEASKFAETHQSEESFDRFLSAQLKVARGEAPFQRDGFLLDSAQHSYPLLTYLLYLAATHQNRLRILDFGGSFGATYYSSRKLLGSISELSWNVVELPRFVEYGKKHFENEILSFHYEVSDVVREGHPDVLLLSGVLSYLPNPYDFIRENADCADCILIDRLPVSRNDNDQIRVQRFGSKVPVWSFSESKWRELFSELDFEVETFDSNIDADTEYYRYIGFYCSKSFSSAKPS